MSPKPVSGINPPPPPSFSGDAVRESWKLFKQKWENYAIITNLNDHPKEYQVALLLHAMGDEGLRIFNGFTFNTAADERTTAEIVAKFDTFVVGEVNETYESFVFNQRVQKGACPNRGFIDFCVSIVWYKVHTTNKINPIYLQILLF